MTEWLAQHLLSLIHLIMAITFVEMIVLALYFRFTKRGVAPSQWLLNVVSGLCLMGALRNVLLAAPAGLTAAWLLAAGAAHVCDLARRWNK